MRRLPILPEPDKKIKYWLNLTKRNKQIALIKVLLPKN